MTSSQFAHALGTVESNNTPYGKFGDGGRAMGQWQLHPDALDTDKNLLGISALLGETWDAYVHRIVTAFYLHYTSKGYNAPEIAMIWHLGHPIHTNDPGWDSNYNANFLRAAGWATRRTTFWGFYMSDRYLALLKNISAFVAGYGVIQYATGYRYVVTFDWLALINGLSFAGLISMQGEGLQATMKTMLGPAKD